MNIDELLKKEAFLSSSNLLRVVVSKKLENIKSITFIQPKIGKKQILATLRLSTKIHIIV